MLRFTKVLLAISFSFIVAACSTHPSEWKPHGAVPEARTLSIDGPVDVVWRRLAEKLKENEFHIESENKDEGSLIATYWPSLPSNYIDCGETTSTKRVSGTEITKSFLSSDTSNFRAFVGLKFVEISRTTKLQTVSTIELKQVGGGVDVSANTDYNLAINIYGYPTVPTSGYVHAPSGNPAGLLLGGALILAIEGASQSAYDDIDHELTFSSTQVSPKFHEFKCVSKGVLEDKILAFAKP